MSDYSLIAGLRQEQMRVQQVEQNSAKYAWGRIDVESTGVGSLVLGPVRFSTTFLSKPQVTTGVEMLSIANRDHWELPHATCGVYRWDRDDDGFYRGAFVFVRVSCESTDAFEELSATEQGESPPDYRLRHHLIVQANAYKKLPDDVVMELEAVDLGL